MDLNRIFNQLFNQDVLKNWYSYLWSLLSVVLVAIVVYLSGRFYCQAKVLKNLSNINNYLIDSVLPLSNLLTKAAGNMHNYKHDYTMHVHPTLFYHQHDQTHRLDFILLKPSYSLIDCSGEPADQARYPLKISFIWQLDNKDPNQYQLICEKQDNFNNVSDSNRQQKVLLTGINQVKFKFFESLNNIEGESIVRLIDPQELQPDHNKQLSAVQIGILLQSETMVLDTEQPQKYHLFQEQYDFLDRFIHKVIYITLKSNIT